MSWRIPLARPTLDERDRAAVMRVLDTSVLSLGPEQDALEAEFRKRFGDEVHAALVSSGTAGLYLALRALGVTGGEVITPSYGFAGTVNAIRLAGARPRFAEIDPETLCVTADTVERAWSDSTRAVLPVHIFGTPPPMTAIVELARSRGVPVLEDACEALGAVSGGAPAGTRGDAGVFAFYPNKQMTTGEGGLVVTRDRAVDECIRCLRNQGRGPGEMEFVAEGFNFRLTELQAALGRAQLARLDEFLERREQLAAHYRERLAPVPGIVTLGDPTPGDRRSWFVFPVFLGDPAWRGPVRGSLARAGIQTAPYFPAIHHQAPYSDPALRGGAALPVTEAAAARGFAIPFHAGLTPAQADEVVAALVGALASRARDEIAGDLPTLLGASA